MPSTSEVGHAKNVANLQKLTEQVNVYTLYNPPIDNIKVANLQTLFTNASAKLAEVEEKRNAIFDSRTIRTSALAARINTITTIAGAEAAVQGIACMDQINVYSLQSLHRSLQ